MRKLAVYILENIDANQLCNNCSTVDQLLVFHFMDSVIPLLLKFKDLAFLY